MSAQLPQLQPLNRRVRAILLTGRGTMLFIKRIKPNKPAYWVAPGGGVEHEDEDLMATLHRELLEELGATAKVLDTAFVLRHEKAGKNLEEYFFICQLNEYDLDKRNGPEFEDPSRGEYVVSEVPLTEFALSNINIKTPELQQWLVRNARQLQQLQPETI